MLNYHAKRLQQGAKRVYILANMFTFNGQYDHPLLRFNGYILKPIKKALFTIWETVTPGRHKTILAYMQRHWPLSFTQTLQK